MMKKMLASLILTLTTAIWLTPMVVTNSGQAPEPPNPHNPDGDYLIFLPFLRTRPDRNWPMVAANPQRTSWSPEQVYGNIHVEWYLPIEAYISQNVQLTAENTPPRTFRGASA